MGKFISNPKRIFPFFVGSTTEKAICWCNIILQGDFNSRSVRHPGAYGSLSFNKLLTYLHSLGAGETPLWVSSTAFLPMSYDQGWGFINPRSLFFSVRNICKIRWVEWLKSHSYLAGFATAKLRRHLPNINVTLNSHTVLWNETWGN